MERADARLDDVNEAIAALLDGTAGAARTVFRMTPVESGADGTQRIGRDTTARA